MFSANTKALFLMLGLFCTFSFSADAAEMRQQAQSKTATSDKKLNILAPMLNSRGNAAMRSNQATDSSDGDNEDDKDDDDSKDGKDDDKDDNDDDDAADEKAPIYEVKAPAKAPKKPVAKFRKVQTPSSKDDESSLESAELTSLSEELAVNLHKQSALKQSLERLDNESADEEIDAAAKQIANETESASMGKMLGHMWKDMRMFELPAYSKYVEDELHDLRQDESDLEAELTKVEGKLSNTHQGAKKKKGKEIEVNEEEGEEHAGETKAAQTNEASPRLPKIEINFWTSSRSQQKSILKYSLVYVVGGILAAVLFKQLREKYFVLDPRPDSFPLQQEFSFHIFGCLADKKLCLLACFCPCLAWANTLDRRGGLLSYWKAFIAFFGLLLLHAYTVGISSLFLVALGVYYRQKLRDNYDLDSWYSGKRQTLLMDIVLWIFCQPCAIIQEAREEGVNRTGIDGKDNGSAGP